MTRDIGNVTAETEVTFEYDVRDVAELRAMGIKGQLESLPFQVQVEYTKLDGSKYIRVLSQNKPVTAQQEVAEEEVDMDLMSKHVTRQCAVMAKGGDYMESRANARVWGKVMQRNAQKSMSSAAAFESYSAGMQVREGTRGPMGGYTSS